jgi:hypothetical protein
VALVEAHHRLLVLRVVDGARGLVAGEDLLDVAGEEGPEAVRLLDPQRHGGRGVGDDERAQARRTPERVLHPQHAAP